MKRIVSLSVLLVAAVFTACQKEAASPERVSPVFTASIAQTKTTLAISGTEGKIAWEAGDEITITDAASVSAVYVAQSTGESSTFTIKSGETAIGSGPYTAVFNGDAPAEAQVYSSATLPAITMAAASSTTSLVFDVNCAVIQLKVSGAGSVKTVMAKGDATALYVLDCGSSGVDISSPVDFFIAVPAGTYKKFYFTNVDNYTCVKTAKSGSEVTVAANVVQPIAFSGLATTDFDGVYLGTTADSGYPLLWADRNVGAVELYNYGYYFSWGDNRGGWLEGTKKSGVDTNYDDTNYANGKYGKGSTLTGNIPSTAEYDGATNYLGEPWRMPTETEVVQLKDPSSITTSETTSILDADNNSVAGHRVTGPSGASIFLPYGGYIQGSKIVSGSKGTSGQYWTSTYADATNAKSWRGASSDGKINCGTSAKRSRGYAIRAVKE